MNRWEAVWGVIGLARCVVVLLLARGHIGTAVGLWVTALSSGLLCFVQCSNLWRVIALLDGRVEQG